MQSAGNAPWPTNAMVVDMLHSDDSSTGPFTRLLDAARQVPLGESLVVIAPCELRDAYQALTRAGFMYETEHVGPDEWLTRFVRVSA